MCLQGFTVRFVSGYCLHVGDVWSGQQLLPASLRSLHLSGSMFAVEHASDLCWLVPELGQGTAFDPFIFTLQVRCWVQPVWC